MLTIHPRPRSRSQVWAIETALSREVLSADSAGALLINDHPSVQLLTMPEREASLARFMETRPSGDLWVFAYGSLIWNPALNVAERRVGRVHGWHRSFCLTMAVGRGTPERPGLALGLDRGGSCHGVAYRIAEEDIASELRLLWSREMLIGGYNPTWVDVIDCAGRSFASAIAFTIDRNHQHYANNLPQQERVRRLATGTGSWGSSADYLFRTIDSLRSNGIRDDEMERLGGLVEAATAHEELMA